jgi:hypothetical protein
MTARGDQLHRDTVRSAGDRDIRGSRINRNSCPDSEYNYGLLKRYSEFLAAIENPNQSPVFDKTGPEVF